SVYTRSNAMSLGSVIGMTPIALVGSLSVKNDCYQSNRMRFTGSSNDCLYCRSTSARRSLSRRSLSSYSATSVKSEMRAADGGRCPPCWCSFRALLARPHEERAHQGADEPLERSEP